MPLLRFIEKILNGIPKNTKIPILKWNLRGKRWIKGAGNNRYWLGIYEKEKVVLFQKIIKQGDIVFDIGAHTGFYTLLASVLAGLRGKVVSFEPFYVNTNYLKQHLKINQCTNVSVIEAAVSSEEGLISFQKGENSFTGRIVKNENGDFKIKSIKLDNFVEKQKVIPTILKIDVEGEEYEVLKGGVNTLKKYHPTIFLATHNIKAHQNCIKFLKYLNYNINLINNTQSELFVYFKSS